jgi:anti-sigma factor RsiW
MRCQDFERLILEAGDRKLGTEEWLVLEQHLAQCPACARFRDSWEDLHLFLQKDVPPLPPELERKVRLACHEELSAGSVQRARSGRARAGIHVPWPIWVVLAVLTVLTAAFLVPGIEGFLRDQKFTLEAVLVLGIILQNALMLFFAPVILRRRQPSRPHRANSDYSLFE